jgi:hypothetical protein
MDKQSQMIRLKYASHLKDGLLRRLLPLPHRQSQRPCPSPLKRRTPSYAGSAACFTRP